MSSSFKPQAAIAVGAFLLLLVLLMGMVGSGANVPRERSGDTYVEAMVGAPHFVNPLLAVSDTDTDLSHLVFSGLTRIDETGNIVPDLASDYTVSADSTVYTFTLKPGLRWQDGEALTADDVYFTLSTILQSSDFPGDPALAQPWKGVNIKLLSKQGLSFTLPAPDASFPQYTTLGILPRHLWSDVKPAELATSEYNLSPVGSGPWRFSQLSLPPSQQTPAESAPPTPSANLVPPAEGVLLEPNPYAASGNATKLKISHIWFRLYPSFGAAFTGFKMGEAHGLGHIPADRLIEVQAVPDATLHRQTLARYNMLLLNVQSPLFDRPETRQAFEYAINRDALSGGQDNPTVPASGPVLTHSWGYDPSVKSRLYNPSEARNLLDKAGWMLGSGGVRARNGVTLTVVLAANSDVPANVTEAQHITADLRAVGIDARLVSVSRDTLLRDYLGPRAFHMVLLGWEASGADPDVYKYWHSSQAVTGGLNFSGWSNPTADKALLDGHTLLDRVARQKAYADFQRAFAGDVPAIILSSPLYIYATRSPSYGVSLPATDMLAASQRFDSMVGWTLQAP
jgi:peptide/nickel transport system substrate-binding protein